MDDAELDGLTLEDWRRVAIAGARVLAAVDLELDTALANMDPAHLDAATAAVARARALLAGDQLHRRQP